MNEVMTRGSVSFSLQLATLPDIRDFCTVLSKTGMVPKSYKDKPDDILVAILHGQEIGLPHLQALQSIAVVNGVPSIYGDAALALVRASNKLDDFDEWFELDGVRQNGGSFPIQKLAEEGKAVVAYCMSKRVGMSRERVTAYSVNDAKRAGLWGKEGTWQTVPQRMLMWRARGWNLRDQFGDILKGLAIYEEAMDIETSRGNDGVYRAPVEIPAEQSDAEMKRIQDLMNQKIVEQGPERSSGDYPASKPATQDAASPQSAAIAEEDWMAAINQIEEDPNLRVLKDLVKVNMKIKTMRLVEKGKREFIRQFRIECEKEGLAGQFKSIFG